MEAAVQRSSLRDAVKTVLAGFIGIRRRADHEGARVSPVHVVVIAVVLVVLFIFALITVVRIVTG
jgi:hypothetical protein